MATPIVPSAGQGLVVLQAGPGASPGYSAVDYRRAMGTGLQEGVIDSGSYKVTTNSSALQLSIAASTGVGAHVLGDSITAQGLYYVAPHSAAIVETAATADVTNPRIDQVILEAADDTHAAGGLNLARVRIVAGTPTAGATLDNRSGVAALPSSAVRLADILVPAAFAGPFVNATHIRDRRPWVRGAFKRIVRNANASATDDYTTTSTSFVAIDSTNLNPRIELSDNPVRVSLRGISFNSGAAGLVEFVWTVGGSVTDGGTQSRSHSSSASHEHAQFFEHVLDQPPGSTLIAPHWKVNSGTGTMLARAAFPVTMIVEELVRQDASND